MPLSSERKKPDYDQIRGGVLGGGKAWVQTAHAPYGPDPTGNAPGFQRGTIGVNVREID